MLKFIFTRNITRDNELEQKKLYSRIQNACPHACVFRDKNEVVISVKISSPSGTANYICEQCGAEFWDSDAIERVRQKYASLEGIKQLNKDHKKFVSLLKKEKFL